MKEFLAGFQVDTENKALAGVCAGLGNYFNIQAISFVWLQSSCSSLRRKMGL